MRKLIVDFNIDRYTKIGLYVHPLALVFSVVGLIVSVIRGDHIFWPVFNTIFVIWNGLALTRCILMVFTHTNWTIGDDLQLQQSVSRVTDK